LQSPEKSHQELKAEQGYPFGEEGKSEETSVGGDAGNDVKGGKGVLSAVRKGVEQVPRQSAEDWLWDLPVQQERH